MVEARLKKEGTCLVKKKTSIIVYILILMLVISGCGAKVVATVNGEKITEPQLQSRIEQVAVMYGYDLSSPDAQEFLGYLKEHLQCL